MASFSVDIRYALSVIICAPLTSHLYKLPIWKMESQPIMMIVKVCEVEWKLNKNTTPPPPQSSVAHVENETVDQVRFVLFAAAKLRLGEMEI